jgi:2-polyprenyl-3-methyl-5-hydroxy-6-metoxy-1,4-benzoquinol methylase
MGTDKDLSEIQRVNRSTYDILAKEYEYRTKDYFKPTIKAVRYLASQVTTGKEVLDVGCGVGLGTKMLNDMGFNLTAIDISSEMVKFAKMRNPRSRIIKGNFLTYKFRKKFDAIFSMAFIHLFPKNNAEAILKKMFNLLKKGGILYFGTTKSATSREGWQIKRDSFFPNSQQKRYRKHWTEDELFESITKAGFTFKKRHLINDPRKKIWMDFVVQKL